MNCDRFDQRMNQLLDEHRSLDDDPVICAHTTCCENCREKLVIWQQIDGLAPVHLMDEPSSRRSTRWAGVLAAGIALGLLFTWGFRREDRLIADSQRNQPVVSPNEGGGVLIDTQPKEVRVDLENIEHVKVAIAGQVMLVDRYVA